MTAKLKDSVSNLARAHSSLREALAVMPRTAVIRSAIIKNFEFNYELAWKSLKRYLEYQGIQTTTPRQVIAEAYRMGVITSDAVWLAMIQDRNLSVHTYDENLSKEMVQRIEENYTPIFDHLVQYLASELIKI
jgi:nucleotidyltransferase substrate binding protein (TIGR01987 family)